MEKKASMICSHTGDDYQEFHGAVIPPIYQNSLFVFPDTEALRKQVRKEVEGYIYTRGYNPTVEVAEKKIAQLEGGEAAKCFSSGMAAISAAIITFLEKGDHVIIVRHSYPCTYRFVTEYLARFGIEYTAVQGDSIEEFERAIKKNTKLIYLESPTSMTFKLQDIKAVAELAKSKGIKTIIDNTWATPIFQNPLKLGIDIVVHTASKYIGGHSDIVAGVVVSDKKTIKRIVENEYDLLGGVIGPFEAWLMTRGLRTLAVRMKQHQQSGMKVAEFLEQHPKVRKVNYSGLKSHPQHELAVKQMRGFSGLLSFEIENDRQKVAKLIDALQVFNIGVSWGGFESLVIAESIYLDDQQLEQKWGMPVGLIRIAVGLEETEILIDDLDRALSLI
ncbi:MAG: aminotransferase class I/II-fold pyridoxal phosphate-dependent enzyme [Clostridia bacterium]|nr:aminotransferase class I/II-fold pyridoxal phosphate-dependent enzyme [Clostridia bacterium]